MGHGIITPPAHEWPHGKLYLSASQDDIVDVTWTIVNLNLIKAGFIDGIENIATHRITPGVPGFYLVIGEAVFRNIVAAKKYEVAVYKNGAGPVVYSDQHSSLDDFLRVPCTDIILLDEDDYLDLRVKHNAGVNTVDISIGVQGETFLTVQRVR